MKIQKNRVLFISYNGLSEPLVYSQVIPYLRELNRKGLHFFLLSFEKKERLKCITKKEIMKLKAELEKQGINWYRLSYHKRPALPAKLFDITAGILYGSYLISMRRVSVVHARGTVPAAMAFIISKLLKIPFIFDMRGMLAEEYADIDKWSRGSLNYKVVSYCERLFLRYANYIVVLTNRIKRVFLETNYINNRKPLNIEVIPCCVDMKKFRIFAKDQNLLNDLKLNSQFIFVYVGSLGTWYMLDEMLDFFKVVKLKITNAHFLILTQSNVQDIEKAIFFKKLNRDDFTIMEVQPFEVPRYICLADAGISFIRPVFSKQASSPTKLGEYLACGLPAVINSNVGDSEELLLKNRTGVVVREFKEKDYLSAIDELLRLVESKDVCSARCRQTAKNFLSLNEGTQKYWNVYKKVLKNENSFSGSLSY